MALWFDKNRDGVSQPGEVGRLSALDVVAIYYKPNRSDSKSGDIRADIGYERLVNGKLVKGGSVDWFSQTFSTRQEATTVLCACSNRKRRQVISWPMSSRLRCCRVARLGDDPLQFHPHQAANHREDLSGYWYWTIKEKGGEKRPGIFAFEQVGTHELTGFSIVEAPLAKNDQNLRSALSAMPATGTIRRDKDGKLRVAMKFLDRQSGGTAEYRHALRRRNDAFRKDDAAARRRRRRKPPLRDGGL